MESFTIHIVPDQKTLSGKQFDVNVHNTLTLKELKLLIAEMLHIDEPRSIYMWRVVKQQAQKDHIHYIRGPQSKTSVLDVQLQESDIVTVGVSKDTWMYDMDNAYYA